jgi:Tfp pilus assembly protein PilN
VRAVNLLPQGARPYQATGRGSGGAYVVVGVLAALVIAALAYVLTTNQITSRKSKISDAQAQRAAADAKAAGLQKYGDFSQIAASRVRAVGSLAVSRIDYERLLRETSRVLPPGVWLTSLDAEATAQGASSSSGAPSPSSSSSGSTSSGSTAPTGPTVHLTGCARSQPSVATTLVRLRAIHGSGDVQLNESGRALKQGGSASGTGTTGTGDCGTRFSFDILVNLTGEVTGFGDLGRKVPATLGGGS